MHRIYKEKPFLHPVVQWLCAAVCGALYAACCLPSFRLIGHFAVQMALSVVLSALCTAIVFFAVPRSLTVLGKALSLFLLCMLLAAVIAQIRAQAAVGTFSFWRQTFFYDKPLTVAVVWAVGYTSVMLLRLLCPQSEALRAFRTDYMRFFRDSTGVFLVFYICVLVYCFLLQRRPGGDAGMNLVPFAMIITYIGAASYAYETLFYLVGNLLCFFPFGFYYRIYRADRTYMVRIMLLPVVISLLIELSQLVFKMGDFDVDDILMNAFGFYFGFFLSYLFDVIRQKRTAGEERSIFFKET
ncbi:MAG: VanZ family protein [Clostridia bacterium]|nr:VanZ family protein [Clostridia bacterium]